MSANETRWTKGPWTCGESGLISGADGHPVAWASPSRMDGRDLASKDGAANSNARLIARAPALYEALQQLHDNIAEYARINNLGGFDNQDMREARAALAEARGEAP